MSAQINLDDDIELAKVELSPHVERLKGLIQLWSIFTSAKTVAEEFLNKFDDLSYQLKIACTKSVAVDYYKPWSRNFSEELNSLKVYTGKKLWSYPFLKRVVDKVEHEQLQELRNCLVAHIDNQFEGLGVTVKGGTIPNYNPRVAQQEGTIDEVFLPAQILLANARGLWWLSDKAKFENIYTHISEAQDLTAKEISKTTANFRDECMNYIHVLKNLNDMFGIDELGFENNNVNVTRHGESPKPVVVSTPVTTKIGDQHTQSLIIVFEPGPEYPSNTEILGKGYRLTLGDFDKEGKLQMNVSFPKYPYPKEPLDK